MEIKNRNTIELISIGIFSFLLAFVVIGMILDGFSLFGKNPYFDYGASLIFILALVWFSCLFYMYLLSHGTFQITNTQIAFSGIIKKHLDIKSSKMKKGLYFIRIMNRHITQFVPKVPRMMPFFDELYRRRYDYSKKNMELQYPIIINKKMNMLIYLLFLLPISTISILVVILLIVAREKLMEYITILVFLDVCLVFGFIAFYLNRIDSITIFSDRIKVRYKSKKESIIENSKKIETFLDVNSITYDLWLTVRFSGKASPSHLIISDNDIINGYSLYEVDRILGSTRRNGT